MRALVFALFAFPALAHALSGVVVSVHKGDTLTLLDGERKLVVRLAEIDAPGLRQSFGERSKQALEEMCLGKQAEVSLIDAKGTGTSGRVLCEGVDAGAEQVAKGLAWVSKRRAASTSPLFFLQNQAQRNREGLWSDPTAMPPWAYRANRRNRL